MAAADRTSTAALVADIGGTWVRFALAQWAAGPAPALHAQRQLAIADHPSLIAAARHYLDSVGASFPHPADAVFAVAGRVEGEHASMTNHPWRIIASECAQALELGRVRLLNDFTAQALALPHLAPEERVLLGGVDVHERGAAEWTYAVLGPGTGLGVSALLRRAGQQFALASEGGHATFAPKTAHQRELLHQLTSRFTRVSYERLLSGNGLCNLHWAASRSAGIEAPEALAPEQVTERARAADPLAREALDMFFEVFGAFAGDVVLTFGAWDGVFLSGGLVPLLLEELRAGAFRQAFENKGRFSSAMARVPVHAVVHRQPGLLGAAAHALETPVAALHA